MAVGLSAASITKSEKQISMVKAEGRGADGILYTLLYETRQKKTTAYVPIFYLIFGVSPFFILR